MKRIPILIAIITGLVLASCSTSKTDLAQSIPDEAFLVATIHPKQMLDKGQVSSMESLTKEIDEEFLKKIAEDPMESGIALNEYLYMFVQFEGENPIIGVTAQLANESKFSAMVDEMITDEEAEVIALEGYSMIADDEAGMAWNDDQMLLIVSPEKDFEKAEMQAELLSYFNLAKEDAVTSVVDFNDFEGKMKDMNLWFTGDELKKVLDMTGAMDEMDIDLPVELYNNYGQFFMDFADGAMYITSETHFSDDVEKAASAFMVAKDNMNPSLINNTPGNDLLMAMAFSIEIDKMVKMVQRFAPPEVDEVSSQIEGATGVSGEEILDALNGDFAIAINGAPEGSMIPVEVFIGIGLDDETLQDKLMGTVGNMAEVTEDDEFFTINANGIEVYSGIVEGTWVITNAAGYKDAIKGDGLEKSLNDTKFADFMEGSMGLYLNLDMTTYPAALQGMMSQGGGPVEMLELLSSSISYLGIEADNSQNNITLKTAKEDENSLYTLLQMMEKAEELN